MRTHMRIIAVAVMIAAPLITLAATSASAATGTPPPPCEAGYSEWQNHSTGGWLLSGNAQGQELAISTTGSCWHWPASGNTGEIKDQGGYCAQYDSHTGYVESFTCTGSQPQEWEITSGCPSCFGGTVAENVWAINNQPQTWMNEQTSTLLVNLEGTVIIRTGTWVKG